MSTPAVTCGNAPTIGYQIRRIPGVEALLGVALDDGSVVIPAAVAGDVLRALVRDMTARVRADGGEVSAGVRCLLYALHTAAQRTERQAGQPRATPVIEQSSDIGTAPQPTATVAYVSVGEAAALLGCSTEYVRRLARAGIVRARRIGARAWAVDPAALDDYRHGRTPAP
ncbi:helix-turn-helix domain-containing protein [Streptomyces sp. NPDC056749]|uniref:helix-turn-helix domain-containing protein n=1 Tax=Streptomyces sp. NPDC056749 TaxID=3345936 RepID=UPI0036A6B762